MNNINSYIFSFSVPSRFGVSQFFQTNLDIEVTENTNSSYIFDAILSHSVSIVRKKNQADVNKNEILLAFVSLVNTRPT